MCTIAVFTWRLLGDESGTVATMLSAHGRRGTPDGQPVDNGAGGTWTVRPPGARMASVRCSPAGISAPAQRTTRVALPWTRASGPITESLTGPVISAVGSIRVWPFAACRLALR